jgi:hypothetical protein
MMRAHRRGGVERWQTSDPKKARIRVQAPAQEQSHRLWHRTTGMPPAAARIATSGEPRQAVAEVAAGVDRAAVSRLRTPASRRTTIGPALAPDNEVNPVGVAVPAPVGVAAEAGRVVASRLRTRASRKTMIGPAPAPDSGRRHLPAMRGVGRAAIWLSANL